MGITETLGRLRDRLLLKLRPRYLSGVSALGGAVGLGVGTVSPELAPVVIGVPAAALAASTAYWKRRPSEYQLRHRLRDDIIVVPIDAPSRLNPFGQNEHRYGQPPGSTRAVEFEMDRSMLVLGESGSGKTEAITLLASQMQTDPTDAVVVFDYKQDYQQFFSDEDVVRLSSLNATVDWNIFAEIRHAEDAFEIAKAICSTGDWDYWTNASAEVLRDVLLLLLKRGVIDDYQPTNADLVDFITDATVERLRRAFEHGEYASRKHLKEDVEASHNILSNLGSHVSQTFVGDFRGEGEFSVREYMEQPDGRILILDFPVDQSAAVKPIFRLLLDWSIRFGLLSDRGSYYLLDEFAALPPLSMLERLVNAGRSYNTYAIAGVQDISQMKDTYGRDGADSLLSGFGQEIHLRVDQGSVRYWLDKLGQERRTEEQEDGTIAAFKQDRVSESAVQTLAPGEGVIHTQRGWQRGRLKLLEQVDSELLPAQTTDHRPKPRSEPIATDGGADTDDETDQH